MGYITHDFYCLKCGRKGIPIQRSRGHMREKGHRKKLYCMYCRQEVNHIEIFNQAQLEKFQEDFRNGVYENEAEESINTCRSAREW